MAGSETPVLLYKNIFFKEHLQWLLLTVSGSSLKLYSLKETLAKMFICECCKIFKNIFRQNTSGWLHLWILRNFPDHFFYRAPLGNCLFNAQVTGFQPQDTIHRWDLPPPLPPPLLKGVVGPSKNWVTLGVVQNFLLERGDKPEKGGLM